VGAIRVGAGFDRGDQHGMGVVVDLVEDAVGAASGAPGSVQGRAKWLSDAVRLGGELAVEEGEYGVDDESDEATSTHRIVEVVLGSLLAFGLLLVPVAYSLARRASWVNGAGDAR
jgi:hypothetical protein